MKEGGRRRHDDGAGAECLRRAALESAHGGHARGDDEDGGKRYKRVLEPLEDAELLLRRACTRCAQSAADQTQQSRLGRTKTMARGTLLPCCAVMKGACLLRISDCVSKLAMMVKARRPASAITDVISDVAGGAAATAPVGRAGARATRHQVLTQPAPRLAAHFNSSRGQQNPSSGTDVN